MYYAGLDLHRKYFTLHVLTSEGQVICIIEGCPPISSR